MYENLNRDDMPIIQGHCALCGQYGSLRQIIPSFLEHDTNFYCWNMEGRTCMLDVQGRIMNESYAKKKAVRDADYDRWTREALAAGRTPPDRHRRLTQAELHPLTVANNDNADDELLRGKSSGGFYFDDDRCTHCGQAMSKKKTTFGFCSDDCHTRAIRPYLPADHGQPKNYEEANWNDYERRRLEIDIVHAGSEYSELLANQEKILAAIVARKRRELEDANAEYLKRWNAQRNYVLQR